MKILEAVVKVCYIVNVCFEFSIFLTFIYKNYTSQNVYLYVNYCIMSSTS